MIKVILSTPEDLTSDLFPDQTPIGETIRHFRTDHPWKELCVDGEALGEADLDKALWTFSKDAVVRIRIVPEPEAGFAEAPEDEAVLEGAEARAYLALARAKELLEEAMKSLMAHGAPSDDDEPPF